MTDIEIDELIGARQLNVTEREEDPVSLGILEEGIDLVMAGRAVAVGVVIVLNDGTVQAAHSDGKVAELVYGTQSLLNDLMLEGCIEIDLDDDTTEEEGA